MPDAGPTPDVPAAPATTPAGTPARAARPPSTPAPQPSPTPAPAGRAEAAAAAPGSAYAERLWPGPLGWALVVGAAVSAGIIVLPVHPVAAAVAAALALGGATTAAVRTAAVIQVRAGELRVGTAHIPVSVLGAPVPLDREGVRRALGPGSDARAYVCLRAWVPGGVQVPVSDPTDPTPSWLVSTRRPRALASAIEQARHAHSVQTS